MEKNNEKKCNFKSIVNNLDFFNHARPFETSNSKKPINIFTFTFSLIFFVLIPLIMFYFFSSFLNTRQPKITSTFEKL